jgi:ABC-type polysaccharide/polyol phosphate transport system ATPase subunit
VDFSGIERFIDTPVKRYSSGMYVRLGFAVAIHVNPEILLVDEVLAVGDLEFQRKCLRAMRQRLGDMTVVFVSHNLAAVNAVCQRAIWLEQGAVRAQGATNDVIEAYVGAVRTE